jgi:hypothetical protein
MSSQDESGRPDCPPETERFKTVAIGCGQTGLTVGYYLAQFGQPFVIVDACERIGDSWRQRWDSFRLFTPACYDGLPGWPFPASAWSFPTRNEIAAGASDTPSPLSPGADRKQPYRPADPIEGGFPQRPTHPRQTPRLFLRQGLNACPGSSACRKGCHC